MWDDLEELPVRGNSMQRDMIASIRKNGSITLNKTCSDTIISDIKDNNYVALSFSRKNNAIVLKFVNNKEHPAVMKLTKNHIVTFGAKSLFNYFKITFYEYIGKYELKIEDIPNLGKRWVILLNNRVVKDENRKS